MIAEPETAAVTLAEFATGRAPELDEFGARRTTGAGGGSSFTLISGAFTSKSASSDAVTSPATAAISATSASVSASRARRCGETEASVESCATRAAAAAPVSGTTTSAAPAAAATARVLARMYPYLKFLRSFRTLRCVVVPCPARETKYQFQCHLRGLRGSVPRLAKRLCYQFVMIRQVERAQTHVAR